MTVRNLGIVLGMAVALAMTPSAAREKAAEKTPPTGDCVQITFQGSLEKGVAFQKEFGAGLAFILLPTNGWTIQVVPAADVGNKDADNYAWPLTPPFRGYGDLNLDTSYGTTAKEAMARRVHHFDFPLSEDAYEQAQAAHDQIVSTEGPEFRQALELLPKIPVGHGELKVLDAKVVEGNPGKVESMKFRVTLVLPPGFQPAQGTESEKALCPPPGPAMYWSLKQSALGK